MDGTASGGVPGAVIGIMFSYTPENVDNAWLTPLLNNVPKTLNFFQQVTRSNGNLATNGYNNLTYGTNNVADTTSAATNPLNIGSIIGQSDASSYFTYPGTLTTPGCNAVVTFYILKEPVPISYRQVVQFTNLLAAAQGGISRGADNRPPNTLLPTTKVQVTSTAWNSLYAGSGSSAGSAGGAGPISVVVNTPATGGSGSGSGSQPVNIVNNGPSGAGAAPTNNPCLSSASRTVAALGATLAAALLAMLAM